DHHRQRPRIEFGRRGAFRTLPSVDLEIGEGQFNWGARRLAGANDRRRRSLVFGADVVGLAVAGGNEPAGREREEVAFRVKRGRGRDRGGGVVGGAGERLISLFATGFVFEWRRARGADDEVWFGVHACVEGGKRFAGD